MLFLTTMFFTTDKTASQACGQTAGSESSIADNTAGDTKQLIEDMVKGIFSQAMLTVENTAPRT